MTTKRIHGPCTCSFAVVYAVAPGAAMTGMGHDPDCPYLYPAQQAPDALTKLVRLIRDPSRSGWGLSAAQEDEALSLISEAREEQRRAIAQTKNDGLEEAANIFIAEENEADRVASAAGSEKRRIEWLERAGEMGSYVRRIRSKKVTP